MLPVTKLVVLILSITFLIACGDKPVKEEAPSGAPVVVGGASTSDASQGEKLQEIAAPVDASKSSQGRDLLSERKIYFDFDKSEIRDEFREVLKAHADFLMANPAASVAIEGHCDERGTREYNMALGERRAHSVLQYLTLQGVSKNQIRTVSFGEERPDVEGHDDSAWKWNRRAVFVYAE